MPRIPPSLISRAAAISPLLHHLLPPCHTISSAVAELRWLTSHVLSLATYSDLDYHVHTPLPSLIGSLSHKQRHHLNSLVARRRKGEPLQYILGTQPFGPLTLQCRPGVLIPRGETEAYTFNLSEIIRRHPLLTNRGWTKDKPLRIVDFCTGTGCIALGLYAGLYRYISSLQICGYDISRIALPLAYDNLSLAISTRTLPPSASNSITFKLQSLFSTTCLSHPPIDILISNPPYISRTSYASPSPRGLSFSTHRFEPKLALVPPVDAPHSITTAHEDAFYERLIQMAEATRARIVLFEVGDSEQAVRVMQLVQRSELWSQIQENGKAEIWRDWPDMQREESEEAEVAIPGPGGLCKVMCRGTGEMRSVYLEIPQDDQID